MHYHEVMSYREGDGNAESWTYGANVNGDWSGEIYLQIPPEWSVLHHPRPMNGERGYAEVRIPFEVLKELVGRSMLDLVEERIEQMTGVEGLDWLIR